MQKFDFDKLEKNSCGNHNFLWLFAVVAVFLTDVTTLASSHREFKKWLLPIKFLIHVKKSNDGLGSESETNFHGSWLGDAD